MQDKSQKSLNSKDISENFYHHIFSHLHSFLPLLTACQIELYASHSDEKKSLIFMGRFMNSKFVILMLYFIMSVYLSLTLLFQSIHLRTLGVLFICCMCLCVRVNQFHSAECLFSHEKHKRTVKFCLPSFSSVVRNLFTTKNECDRGLMTEESFCSKI